MVPPGNFCDKLSQNCRTRVFVVQPPHVPYVARRETLRRRERGAQIARDPFDHGDAPAERLLLLGNGFADVPVQRHKFAVDRARGGQARGGRTGLEVADEA